MMHDRGLLVYCYAKLESLSFNLRFQSIINEKYEVLLNLRLMLLLETLPKMFVLRILITLEITNKLD